MRIRNKLFLAFGFYIFLAAVLGFLAYKELSTITKRLRLVETASDINRALLEVRRHEKNFLLRKDQDSYQELEAHLGKLRADIDGIHVEIVKEMGSGNYDMMKKAISDYHRIFDEIAGKLKEEEALVGALSIRGREIEKTLSGKELQTFLVLRRQEKNLIIRRDQEAYDVFQGTLAALNGGSREDLKTYATLAEKLFRLYENEEYLIGAMRLKAREIETFTENLSKKERQNIDKVLKVSMNLLLYTLCAMILLGAVINIKLAASIAKPLGRLEAATKKVALGNLSEKVEVTGNDELTALEISFNQMEDRLRDTLSSLELAIKNLHAKQKQLVEAEKLASLGRIAAGVAHEINNPLAIINEKAGLMKDILQLSGDMLYKEKFSALADSIIDSVSRCRTITHRLLGFARDMEVTIKSFDLNHALREVIGFLEKEILFKNIDLQLDLSEGLPEVMSDRGQLQQVFLNIIKNAVDAVAEGGTVSVSTSAREGMGRVVIKDDGHGIPKEILKNIFEPFFTTKEKGKGTGLGLAISYGIVKKLGGDIQVESEVGKGTTFIIDIPINGDRLEGGGRHVVA